MAACTGCSLMKIGIGKGERQTPLNWGVMVELTGMVKRVWLGCAALHHGGHDLGLCRIWRKP